jgi:hypothetical protein
MPTVKLGTIENLFSLLILSHVKSRKTGFSVSGNQRKVSFRKAVPAQPVDATPPGVNLSPRGGVHETRETMEAFWRPAGRYVEPLEGGRVVA